MVESKLLLFPGLANPIKRVLQALLLTKLTMSMTALLCGFVMGLVLGANVNSSLWLTSIEPQAEVNEGAFYQGKPASFWIGQLQDHDPFFRLDAVRALEHIGPKEKAIVLALARMLNDSSEVVRTAAALALSRRFGPEAASAIPELIGCLKDRHHYLHLRVLAVRTLGNIGPSDPAVLPVLLAALQDEEPLVRRVTLQTLGTMGPRAKIAVPALRKAQADSDPAVRQEAVDALTKIDHQEATDKPSSAGPTSENDPKCLSIPQPGNDRGINPIARSPDLQSAAK
jgi:hypothetical protein